VSENLLEPDEIDLNEKTLRKSGLIGLIGTQIGKWSLLSGGLRVEKYKLQTSDISALNDVMGLKFHDVFTYLMLNFLIDTMDKFPIPTTGIKHYVSIGTTGRVFGEKNNLIKINGSLGRYFTIKGRHTFFPQLRACWSNDTLPEVEQVYLGGISPEPRYRDINVYNYIPFIGLPPLSMPGDIMGLAHFEYRLSITKTFYTYFLADWGYIWDREKNQASNAAKEFLQKAPIGLGVSIVYETPVGPLRFTYGQLLPDHLVGNDISSLGLNSKPQFYFSAGRDF
jgi:outer membrane protein assembly factor BamA